jgi:hypothetical protein
MNRWTGPGIIVLALHLGLGASAALAQTPATTTTTSSTTTATTSGDGSTVISPYERLSPGNQKIARAMFEAQSAPTAGTTGGTAPSASAPAAKTLTLDEIAAQKSSGKGWGSIFKSMKAQGLIQDKNLGQVISRYNHQRSTSGVVTTASGRAFPKSNGGGSGRSDDTGSTEVGGPRGNVSGSSGSQGRSGGTGSLRDSVGGGSIRSQGGRAK